MVMNKNDVGLRVLIGCLVFSFAILAYAIVNTHAPNVKQKVSDKLVEYLSEMDSGLAKR